MLGPMYTYTLFFLLTWTYKLKRLRKFITSLMGIYPPQLLKDFLYTLDKISYIYGKYVCRNRTAVMESYANKVCIF